MAFDQTTITEVTHVRDGADLLISWSSTAPAGTQFQLYVARRLAWHGTQRSVSLPYPTNRDRTAVPIDIGAVGDDEATTDFSASLPALPYSNRARLTWYGGTYESETLTGFHVYRGTVAGGAVSYATPIATVAAYPQGKVQDGAGIGPAGYGGAGEAAGVYTYDTDPLAPGVWHFGVKPFDAAGNEGTAEESTFTATGPPNPPTRDAAGRRLAYAYDPGTRIATLSWLASPP